MDAREKPRDKWLSDATNRVKNESARRDKSRKEHQMRTEDCSEISLFIIELHDGSERVPWATTPGSL